LVVAGACRFRGSAEVRAERLRGGKRKGFEEEENRAERGERRRCWKTPLFLVSKGLFFIFEEVGRLAQGKRKEPGRGEEDMKERKKRGQGRDVSGKSGSAEAGPMMTRSGKPCGWRSRIERGKIW